MSSKKRDQRQYIVINEERLISEVQLRPILYDKALKGYRKPTIRELAWQEVATLLESTVDESKKRWRSLRDAFMKQYKQYAADEPSSAKKKKWLFYDQMEFLRPFLELTNDIHLSREEYMDEYMVSKHDAKRVDYFSSNAPKAHIFKGNVIIQQAAHQMLGDDDDDDEEVLDDNVLSDVVDGGVSEVVGDGLGDPDVEEVEQLEDHVEVIDMYEERDIISEIFTTTPGIGTSSDSVSGEQDSPEDILPHEHISQTQHQQQQPQQQQQHHQQSQQQQQVQTPLPTHLIVKTCLSDSQLYTTQQHTFSNSNVIPIEDPKDQHPQQQQQQQQQQPQQQQQQHHQHQQQQQHQQPQQSQSANQQLDITNVSPFGLDPDERFLLSCSPILKRLSHKKNAMARLKMQQILYEIEFGENIFG